MVALTLHIDGNDALAQEAINLLLAKVEETGSKAFWPVAEGEKSWYHWRTMASTEKNTAAAIYALVALRADHPVLPKAVQWLMEQRQSSPYGGAGWRNTQATAFAVLGLTGYLRVSNELASDYTYTVFLNDAKVASGRITPDLVMQPVDPVELSGDKLRIGENTLRIERSGANGSGGIGSLYYTLLVEQELFYDSFQPVNSVMQGLAVNRTYRLANKPIQASSRIEDNQLEDEVYQVGDLVEVEVTVKAKYDMAYVLVSDPIPAGFEAVRERMNVVSYSDFWPDAPFFWREWGYNRKELRDDSVDLFITNLWEGSHSYTYLMRATTAGEYSVLPTLAYPMYEPEIWGRSQSKRVIVSPEELTSRPTLTGDFDRSCQITTFDTQQVAAAWGHTNSSKEIAGGNGVVDLEDVAAIAMRRGATCMDDLAAPGTASGEARYLLQVPQQTLQAGQEFEAILAFDGGTIGRGFGVTIDFDHRKLRVSNVRWNKEQGNTLPLGPNIRQADGLLTFGTFDLPTNLQSGETLATITFTVLTAGSADITVMGAQATDSAGNLINATAQKTGGPITIKGSRMYMPIVQN